MGYRGVDLAAIRDRKARQKAAKEAEEFGAAIGKLVRAIDYWETADKDHLGDPPDWALRARDKVVKVMLDRSGVAN
jgi:hypothetical protein